MPLTKLMYSDDRGKPGFNLGITLQKKTTKGEIGIEIEVEGKNLLYEEDTPQPWAYHKDHSLRGEENAEYVLVKPLMFEQVPSALDKLWSALKEKSAVFDDSNRTSVHIHLNCQEFHMNRLASFFTAWYAIEEVLVEYCGEHRVGNLFCLRAVDAPAIVNHMRKFIRSNGEYPIHDILHYSALNPHALTKYGSLEVRTMRGLPDPKQIQDWVDILHRLYTLSGEFEDPRDLVAMYSGGGPLSFFDFLMGDMKDKVLAGIKLSAQERAEAMQRGIRFAQDIAYCRDWDAYKPMKLKADPFGRDSKKLAHKIANVAENGPVVGSITPAPMAPSLAAAMEAALAHPPFHEEYQSTEADYDNPFGNSEGW